MISPSLLIAAVLTVAVGLVHSVLGEWRLIGPLLDPLHRQGILAKSTFARSILRFAWHLTTIAWWGFAVVLAGLATAPIDPAVRMTLIVIATTFLLTGILILVVSRAHHLAWPVFLAISALSVAPLFG